jgi:arylsulfatase A-like enzyme
MVWHLVVILGCMLGPLASVTTAAGTDRPNILFAFADDWGTHAGVYGTAGIETPHFDRLANEGVLFERAFAAVPSCTPSRGAVLTGQHPWRLGPGANLHSTLPAELPVYPHLLEKRADYFTGHTGKGWGPGKLKAGGRTRRPTGAKFANFSAFLKEKPADQPFCFWFGTSDPHRPYRDTLHKKFGIDPAEVHVPAELPDTSTTRRDIANYYAEAMRFDRDLGQLVEQLKQAGLFENTLIVVSGDHGWPFPRGKSNLYDAGCHVPLAVHWPAGINGGRRVKDFVNLVDLAPTFLRAAGVKPPQAMTGHSLMPILRAKRGGRVTAHRSHVILAKERHHGRCRPNGRGYPSRAIRTKHFLYIRNDRPHRWPAGSPWLSSSQNIFSDVDAGPTKQWMIEHANEKSVRARFAKAFGKRPAEELYDLRDDPRQMENVANQSRYQAIQAHLAATLEQELKALEDPRARGEGGKFDSYPYYTGYGNKQVTPPTSVQRALNLKPNPASDD